MDFSLSQEQTAIYHMAREFGEQHIAPNARDWDRAGEIPMALWPQLAGLGFGGLYVSQDSGGTGLSRLEATLVFEGLARSCISVAAFLSIHNMCAAMIDRFGSPDLKARVLPDAVAMKTLYSYCLTEPGSGSDAAALRTRAKRSNQGYELTGTKAFISGAGYSHAYVVMARTGDDTARGISSLIVQDGAPGLSFGGLEDKMGWRSQPTRAVQFDACVTPADNLIG
ncbi:MAG: acyl-CoA dehydrogenase family protein, partial [Paracoccaceae bacterium]